jgi:two-component system response regulator AgrA
MLNVIICEDNPTQLENMNNNVRNYITANKYNIDIAVSTTNPTEVLNYLEAHPKQTSIYILDVDLQHEINGLALASQIRKADTFGAIIFVTTHLELLPLTFKYKMEAMDYIIKDRPAEVETRIQECIDIAYQRYLDNDSSQANSFQVKDGSRTRFIPLDDIIFFSSHPTPHKVILHLDNSQINFYGSINELAQIGADFYRSHQSYVVNLRNIKQVDHITKKIEMINGEIALVGTKKVQELLRTIASLTQ